MSAGTVLGVSSLPQAARPLVGQFRIAFSAPVFQQVLVLLVGAVLAPGRRTVAACLWAARAVLDCLRRNDPAKRAARELSEDLRPEDLRPEDLRPEDADLAAEAVARKYRRRIATVIRARAGRNVSLDARPGLRRGLPGKDNPATAAEWKDEVERALRGCNRGEQLTLRLHHLQDMTMGEIARSLGLSKGVARLIYRTVVDRLRAAV